MNKKIIFLPLAAAGFLALAGVPQNLGGFAKGNQIVQTLASNDVDYSANSNLWYAKTGVGFGDGTMSLTEGASHAVTNSFGGNATISFEADLSSLGSGWGGMVFTCKGPAAELASNGFSWAAGDKHVVTGNGYWVGLQISNGSVGVLKCVNGKVTVISDNTTDGISGNVFWNVGKQKTKVTFTTQDTETGIHVKVDLVAEASEAGPGGTYSKEFDVNDTAFWGAQSASVYASTWGVTPSDSNNTLSLKVDATDSGKTRTIADNSIEATSSDEYISHLDKAQMISDGVAITADGGKVVTNEFGSNATINFEFDATNVNSVWGGMAYFVKGSAADLKASSCTYDAGNYVWNGVGNWVALLATNAEVKIFQCINGTVTDTGVSFAGINGNYFWYVNKQVNTIKAVTQDTNDGVEIVFTFSTVGQTPLSATVTINETALQGNQAAGFMEIIGGGVGLTTTSNTLKIKVDCEETPIKSNYVDYSADETKWTKLDNSSITDEQLKISGVNSNSVTTEFGGNSTIKYAVNYTQVGGSWGAFAFMFKGTATDLENTSWSYTEPTTNVAVSTGSWLALSVNHGKYEVVKCINGTITSLGTLLGSMNGLSFWHLGAQLSELTVTTTDTDSGVHIDMTFKASGHEENDGNAYSASFDVNDKALWGKQSASFRQITGDGTFNNGSIKVSIFSKESTHTKAEYHVSSFADAVAAIPAYESVTPENYSSLVAAYNAAKTAYDALTEDELLLINSADKDAMDALKAAIDGCDKVPFIEAAIAALDLVDYTRDNYEAQKALVEDAKAKYDSLDDSDKARVESTFVEKLQAAVADLEEFEEHLGYADEAVELIDAITLPITHYGRAKHEIAAAKAAYDVLDEFEMSLVTNAETLTSAIAELAQFKADNQNENYNFALDPVNFADTVDSTGITMKDGSMIVNSTDRWASLYPTAKVADGKEVQIDLDSCLSESGWGNFYFVFKSDKAMKHHDMGTWAQDGNYAVLLLGSDGFKVLECVDGVMPMAKDASGNPIADWSKGTDFSGELIDPVDQFDAFHIWEQYTILKIKTVDNYSDDVYTGYTTTITLVGGHTFNSKTVTYTSTNTHAEGAGYVGLELYTGAPINRGNGSGFTVDGWYIEGVTEYDGAAVKAEIKAKEDAAVVDGLIAAIGEVTLDSKSAIQAARAAYVELSDLAKAKVTKLDVLEAAETRLASLEEAAAAAELAKAKTDAKDELDDAYAALDLSKYSEENKAALLSAVTAGKAAIDAATDKAGVASALSSAKAALNAVPQMEPVNPNPTPEDKPEEGFFKKPGCGGSVIAASALVSALAVAGAALIATKKKED